MLLANAIPISQGAEAKVYKANLHESSTSGSIPVFLKHRFHKQYRHPTLDTSLTRARIAGEARTILKCLRSGVRVPGIRLVDAAEGVIGFEWIDGKSVRALLGGGAEGEEESEWSEDLSQDEPIAEETVHELQSFNGLTPAALMSMIGEEIGTMHLADVIHGDLTTSNMMLRLTSPGISPSVELLLVDFGLAYTSTLVEDKAVDLYVLERAFASTHPDSEPLFATVLEAYGKKLGKEWTGIKRRLDDVRLRGRKRSMVG